MPGIVCRRSKRLGVGFQPLQHGGLDGDQPPLQGGFRGQQIRQQVALPIGQGKGQGTAERRQLAADMARQPGEDGFARIAVDQTRQHDPAVDAEHIADDAADPDASPIDGLLHPVAQPGPLLHQAAAMAVQRAQGVELPIRHHARPPQTELAHPSQPAAVLDIRLAPAQLLHMLRMQQLHFDPRVPAAGPTAPANRSPCLPSPLPQRHARSARRSTPRAPPATR